MGTRVQIALVLTLVLVAASTQAADGLPDSHAGETTYELEMPPLQPGAGALPPGTAGPWRWSRSYDPHDPKEALRSQYQGDLTWAYPRLRLCYESELLVNESASGTVRLLMTVAPDGHVDFAVADGDDVLNSPDLMRCIAAQMQQVQFSKRKDERWINLLATIHFVPSQDSAGYSCTLPHWWNSSAGAISPTSFGLDPDVLRQLKGCWLARLREEPLFETRTTLSVDFAPDGTVQSARVRKSSRPDTPFEQCLVSKMQEWELDTEVAKVARHLEIPVSFTFQWSAQDVRIYSSDSGGPPTFPRSTGRPDWWFDQ